MKRTLITAIGTQAVIQLIGLVTGVLVARLAGVEGRGELAAIIAWVSALTYLGDVGLPVAYTYTAAQSPNRVPQLLGNALMVTAVQWVTVGAIGSGIIVIAFLAMSENAMSWALVYLWIYIPLNLFTRYLIAIHQGLGRAVSFNLIRLCVPASYLLLLLVLSWSDRASVGWILAAGILSNLVAAVLAIVLTATAPGGLFDRIALDFGIFRQNLRYGLRAQLGTVEPLNGLRADVLILTLLITAHDLGLYAVAVSAAAALKALSSAFGLVALPEIARRAEWSLKKQVAGRIFGATCVIVGVAALLIGIWAEPLVTALYGQSFAGARALVQVMLVAAVANSLYALLRDMLQGFGHPLRSSLPEVVGLAVAMVAFSLFVPAWGVVGGAWSVAAGSLAALAAAGLAVRRVQMSGAPKTRIAHLAGNR